MPCILVARYCVSPLRYHRIRYHLACISPWLDLSCRDRRWSRICMRFRTRMVRIIVAQHWIFSLTYPVFHPPSRLLNTHLPHPHSLFDPNTCIIWPHISLSVITPKTVYYLINIVVKTQTSPPASSITDLLNGMCPLGNISYFLLVFLLRLVSP